MKSHVVRTLGKKSRLVGGALAGMLAAACGAGSGFRGPDSQPDGSSLSNVQNPGEDGSVVVVVAVNASDAATGVDGIDAPDAPPTDASSVEEDTVDAPPSCSSSQIACGSHCVPIDTDHCGSCTTKCAAPDAGAATCTQSGQSYTCGVACDTNRTRCGTTCVDTQSDPSHCGRCGHSCEAGACVMGQCQSWIVTNTSASHAGLPVVRGGTYGHVDIATDGTNVLWVDPYQGVLQVSATAGASAPVVNLSPMQSSTSSYPADLAIGHGVVVWTVVDVNNGVSLWAAKEGIANSGAQIASLGTGSAGDLPSGLALDATGAFAYFLDTENNNSSSPQSPGLYKCDLANKSCALLDPVSAPLGFTLADDLAMADGILFWTDSGNGTISRADYAKNAIGAVVTDQIDPTLLVTDAAYVYWASIMVEMTTSNTPIAFSILRTSQSTPGTADTVLPRTNGSLQDMGTDGTYFYVSHNTSTQNGQLDYLPADGSAPLSSLKDHQQAYGLAVGGGAIYWLNGDDTIDGIAAP
jgi:hypothetical protein